MANNTLNIVRSFPTDAQKIKTKSGATVDIAGDRWAFRDSHATVALDFTGLTAFADEVVSSFKKVAAWELENMASATVMNHLRCLNRFSTFLCSNGVKNISIITAEHLLGFRSSFASQVEDDVNAVGLFLRRLHSLGFTGVEPALVDVFGRIKWRRLTPGVAVTTRDPETGPLTDIELAGVQAALNLAHEQGDVADDNYLLAWLTILLGQRPAQYALLKVRDVTSTSPSDGTSCYFLSIPRVKQKGGGNDLQKRVRSLTPKYGKMLLDYANAVRADFSSLMNDSGEAPLFPHKGDAFVAPPGLEYHSTAKGLSTRVIKTLERLTVMSERTGLALNITMQRFRRTIGTRAAAEGHSPLIIAELLDHSGTQNVGVYVESTPAIIERIDKAIATQMAPLAQAFAGVLIRSEKDAIRGEDTSSRIVDPRIDPSFKPMGSCGKYTFCGQAAPIACYTCANFQPWLDGAHEAVLDHLLSERERLITTADLRIASIHDRTILAVATVVEECKKMAASSGGDTHDN